jgi:nitroreductase
MISREDVDSILHSATQAPSGDNSQPWRFRIDADSISILNTVGKDYSPYNYKERGSIFAIGAAVENAVITANSFHLRTDVSLFPDQSDPDVVATLRFQPSETLSKDPLAPYVESRMTNRKPYAKKALHGDHRTELLNVFHSASGCSLSLIETSSSIARFGKLVSLSDQLIFEEQAIHDAIFSSIRWTRDEEQANRGMYIKTLELPPPALLLFKHLRHWSNAQRLNRISIARFIAAQSAKVYSHSAAIGMITIPNEDSKEYVMAGRAFERLWLTATKLGIQLQPMAALPYLAQRITEGSAEELSENHQRQIQEQYDEIRSLFSNPPGITAMMFRVGYGPLPSAHSLKASPKII